jgi:hypothetical protein
VSESFQFYRWDTGEVIVEAEAETLKEALEKFVSEGKNFYRASLDGARLDGARLDGARLDGARLDGASLVGASLDRARLDGASLVGASLDGARLDGARLDGARLDGASLDRARLDGASLVGARLDGARLDGARLDFIKHDLWGVLLHSKHEVSGLVTALQEGRVDGSVYEGPCACLVGTLANVRGCRHTEIPGLQPDSSRPAEIWFMGINKGDSPESNQIVKITLDWIAEFQQLVQS